MQAALRSAPFTDRTGATDEEFRARVAVFDAAEEPEEVVVERVARAIAASDARGDVEATDVYLSEFPGLYQSRATAAIAALRANPAPEPVAHNHTRFRNDAGPWSPCPVSCPAAGLLR